MHRLLSARDPTSLASGVFKFMSLTNVWYGKEWGMQCHSMQCSSTLDIFCVVIKYALSDIQFLISALVCFTLCGGFVSFR